MDSSPTAYSLMEAENILSRNVGNWTDAKIKSDIRTSKGSKYKSYAQNSFPHLQKAILRRIWPQWSLRSRKNIFNSVSNRAQNCSALLSETGEPLNQPTNSHLPCSWNANSLGLMQYILLYRTIYYKLLQLCFIWNE